MRQDGDDGAAAGGVRDLLSGADEGVRDAAGGGGGRDDANSQMMPLRFSLALDKLPPGEYDCQVTVLDPTGQKAAFWQAPVMVIP